MRLFTRTLVLLCLAIGTAAAPAQDSPPLQWLTPEQAHADIALLRTALETIHPGLYRRTGKPELDRAFAQLQASAAKGMQDTAFYRELSALLAQVRCTHTKADQTSAMDAWRTDHASHLPFRFRLIEGRMLVVASDPAQPRLPRGAEVLSINGKPVAELVARLGAYVAVDGNTEASRASVLADDGDLMGASFDHFLPYVFGFSDRLTLRLRDTDTAPVRTQTLRPLSFRAWTSLDNDGLAYRRDFAEATTWRMLDARTGYLRIDTFVNYRKPVDAAALYARALQDLKQQGAVALVVDLRYNGGGSNDAALALIDALAQAPYTYQRAMRYKAVRYGELPRYISSWGDRDALFNPPLERFTQTADGQYDLLPTHAPDVLLPRTPARAAFAGPVTVLSGPANASGATMVIAKLRDLGRARVVGERSGGSADGPTAGTIFNVKLPHSGIRVRIPLMFNQMAVDRFDPQGGLTPDVVVQQTVEDFRAGRDRVLEWVIAELGKAPAS